MIRADGHLTVSPQMRTRWTQAPNQPLGTSPSHPAEWTPELAFLTSSQLALMSSWPEEPSRQNLLAPSPKPEGQRQGIISQWTSRDSGSTGHPAGPSHHQTLSSALKTRLPRLHEGIRGPRPWWRQQSRPDSCTYLKLPEPQPSPARLWQDISGHRRWLHTSPPTGLTGRGA